MAIRIVDVFAGPGGLNEGFASFTSNGQFPFEIASSIEKGSTECDTLLLRSALRIVERNDGATPNVYVKSLRAGGYLKQLQDDTEFAPALEIARTHVNEFTLDKSSRQESDALIKKAISGDDPWVLVGGPPCQLYSLVGRARAGKLPGFEADVRHVLYKEYLHIIRQFQPVAFVMENVKGMLSAMHQDGQIFDLIREDIANLGYDLRSFVVDGTDLNPSDFVIRTNEFGVPQKRHRVILFGVRNDLAHRKSRVLTPSDSKTVKDAIYGLPQVRSRISPIKRDDYSAWLELRNFGLKEAGRTEPYSSINDETGGIFVAGHIRESTMSLFDEFVLRPNLNGYAQHETRSHMDSDISRYAYYAERLLHGEKVRVNDLTGRLKPNHKNIGRADTPFTDRFRVQGWDDQSTTVVSHISKDGHYFIHPDPLQARSLTVREAARLQSFPDDYLFCGTRTQQYHQVGNAVPPLLANQIAEIVFELLS